MLTKANKKAIKRIMKRLSNKGVIEPELNGLINQFTNGDGESGVTLYIFEGTVENAITELDKIINLDGVSFNSAYDCTGRYFSYPVIVREHKTANRIIISQRWAYDV